MKIAFDTEKAIAAAWTLLWKDNLKERGKRSYRESSAYYLTASDVEDQVRRFATETMEGKRWGSTGRAYGRDFATVKFRGNLKRTVRGWLLHEVRCGRLASHNFGRGHISGMRFRPAGEPISAVEVKTLAAKERRKDHPRPQHFGKTLSARPLCVKPRRSFTYRPSKAWVTSTRAAVTCPRCLKLLAAKPVCEEVA